MLRKISYVAAVAAVLSMPVVAMAAGHGGGGHGGGGMHAGTAMHAGSAGRSFGHAGTFRSATFFHGRHAFFRDRHFRHHRRLFAGGFDLYGPGSCYRHVLTPWGWRWRWTCGYGYY
jgi:hypothetical protein